MFSFGHVHITLLSVNILRRAVALVRQYWLKPRSSKCDGVGLLLRGQMEVVCVNAFQQQMPFNLPSSYRSHCVFVSLQHANPVIFEMVFVNRSTDLCWESTDFGNESKDEPYSGRISWWTHFPGVHTFFVGPHILHESFIRFDQGVM